MSENILEKYIKILSEKIIEKMLGKFLIECYVTTLRFYIVMKISTKFFVLQKLIVLNVDSCYMLLSAN